MNLDDHPLLPTLVQQFVADDPALPQTAQVLYGRGVAVTEVMCALTLRAWTATPHAVHRTDADTCVVAPDFAALYQRVTPPNTAYTPQNGVQLTKLVRTATGAWEAPTFPRFAPVIFSRTFVVSDAIVSGLLAATGMSRQERRAVLVTRPGACIRFDTPLAVDLTAQAGRAVGADGEQMCAMIVSRATLCRMDVTVRFDSFGVRL